MGRDIEVQNKEEEEEEEEEKEEEEEEGETDEENNEEYENENPVANLNLKQAEPKDIIEGTSPHQVCKHFVAVRINVNRTLCEIFCTSAPYISHFVPFFALFILSHFFSLYFLSP